MYKSTFTSGTTLKGYVLTFARISSGITIYNTLYKLGQHYSSFVGVSSQIEAFEEQRDESKRLRTIQATPSAPLCNCWIYMKNKSTEARILTHFSCSRRWNNGFNNILLMTHIGREISCTRGTFSTFRPSNVKNTFAEYTFAQSF